LLNTIAEERVRDMFEKQYTGHISPIGEGASDVAQKVGYRYKIIAENIAGGMFLNNRKIIDGWLQSPGHRKNMLSQETKEIGVAILKGTMNGQDTWLAVQIFGLQSPPVSSKTCVLPPQELYNRIEIKKAEIEKFSNMLDNLRQELDAEKTAIEDDRRMAGSNRQAAQNLSIKIMTYNEKSNWYNNSLADARVKSTILKNMVNEYNRMLQDYNECQRSK
jgi:hypothetical protein